MITTPNPTENPCAELHKLEESLKNFYVEGTSEWEQTMDRISALRKECDELNTPKKTEPAKTEPDYPYIIEVDNSDGNR